jgi:hypothetical protein
MKIWLETLTLGLLTSIVLSFISVLASVVGSSIARYTSDAVADATVHAACGAAPIAVVAGIATAWVCVNPFIPLFGAVLCAFFGQPLGYVFLVGSGHGVVLAFQDAAVGTIILMFVCLVVMAVCALRYGAIPTPPATLPPATVPPLRPPHVVIITHPDGDMALAPLAHDFHRLPHSRHSANVVMGSSADLVCSCV